MVLKDIPYRDGKLFYVKCALKYLQRIVLSSRLWFSSVSDTCDLPDIRDRCAVTCVTCVILVTWVTCVTCDYVRLWPQEMHHLLNFSGHILVIIYILPFALAIELVSDWDERSKWDKTFDGVSFLDQMADFKLLKWWVIMRCLKAAPHYPGEVWNRLPVILDLCPKKTWPGKSHYYRDVIVFEELRFQNVYFSRETQSCSFQIPPSFERFRKIVVTD